MRDFYSNQPKLKQSTFILDKFLGCDFTQGDFITDYRRSPNCKNLIWGTNPYIPRMREGYKQISAFRSENKNENDSEWKINGIHVFGEEMIVHAGTNLFKVSKNEAGGYKSVKIEINGKLENSISKSFQFEGADGHNNLYIIGGGRYFQYDGENIVDVKSIAYCPHTVIGRTYEGGGRNKESVNLLSGSQIYSFLVTEKEIEIEYSVTEENKTTLTLAHYEADIRNLAIYRETPSGDKQVYGYTVSEKTVTFDAPLVKDSKYKAIYLTWSGEEAYFLKEDVLIDYIKVKGDTLSEGSDYTYDSSTGKITFTAAPKGIRGREGDDIIFVKFTKALVKSVIEGCSVFDIFGGRNDTRVFLTGNKDYPNCDWHSGLYDATYFPDTSFTPVGTRSSRIMGYIKQYNTQMIIKEDNAFEASVYLRQFSIDDEGNTAFPIEQGITGVGAISDRAFGYINGEAVFLTSKGVVGVEGTNVDYRNLCQARSEMVDSKLTNSGDLRNAFSIDFENKYYLFTEGGRVYVADARMMYRDALGRPQYEWFLWENVYANCAAVFDGRIVFGDDSGNVFVFKKPGDEDEFADEKEDVKTPVEAIWETPRLYFGSISNKKYAPNVFCFCDETIIAKMKIIAVADDRKIDLGTYDNTGVLDFSRIDLEDFNFNGMADEDVKTIRSNIQRFTSIKFRFSSERDDNNANLGFGLKLLQVSYIYL